MKLNRRAPHLLAGPCATCDAAARQPCRTLRTGKPTDPHLARISANARRRSDTP